MKTLNKIIVSQNAFDSSDFYDIINSNISVINLLLEEGAEDGQIHKDAHISNILNFYDAQYRNGNFSQFVWNSGWDAEINDYVEQGLKAIGATKHLALFQKMKAVADGFSQNEMETFLNSEYFGTNPLRDRLKNDEFYEIDEDISELNAKFLKNHPDLQVLSIDEMYRTLEEFLEKPISRE